MKRVIARGMALAFVTGHVWGCTVVEAFLGQPLVKLCGRDFGDRVYWTPVPLLSFSTQDCARLQDGLVGDLHLGCYSRNEGVVDGGPSLEVPTPNRCGWEVF